MRMDDNVVTVGITCIGSGIGQSVVNALRLSSMQVRTVGFGNDPFEYGALDCDEHHSLPAINDPVYIDLLIEKCLQSGVRLIIPGLDGDVHNLAQNRLVFAEHGIEVITADEKLVSLCRDKERLSNKLNQITDRFLPAYNKHSFQEALQKGKVSFPCIAKPVDGSGSVGVKLIRHREELKNIPETYVCQELLSLRTNDRYYEEFKKTFEEGRVPQLSELSLQYVTGRRGEFLGKIATVNRLKHGVPVEIIPIQREDVWEAVYPILSFFRRVGLRGPVNIQGRITEEGVRFFEVNPRFTGLTGLRARMGFNEVEACLHSWMGQSPQEDVFQGETKKFGLRQVADRGIAINEHTAAQEVYQQINHRSVDPRKVLLITGSTGYLGRNLIRALDPEKYEIWILSTHPDRVKKLFQDKVSRCYSEDVFQEGGLPWGGVDILLHAGFARPYRSNQDIADSLAFTEKLFRYAGRHETPAIINISSQSIYGQIARPPWSESTPASPESPYAAAKYASELMLSREAYHHPHLHVTSLRLAGLTGGQEGLVPVDLVTKFVQQALEGGPLEILGEHRFERLDIRDAVQGIIHFLDVPSSTWGVVYNLGKGETFTITDLAGAVLDEVRKATGKEPPEMITRHIHQPLHFGMDSSAFYEITGWVPEYSLRDSICSLISYLSENEQMMDQLD